MSDRHEKEIAELQANAEKARLFRDLSASTVWKKYLEPFLYKLQQDAEAEAINSFRSSRDPGEIAVRGALASGRAQGAEEFVKFILRGIADAKDAEIRLKQIEEENKKREAAK